MNVSISNGGFWPLFGLLLGPFSGIKYPIELPPRKRKASDDGEDAEWTPQRSRKEATSQPHFVDVETEAKESHDSNECDEVSKSERSLYGQDNEMHPGKSEINASPESGSEISGTGDLAADSATLLGDKSAAESSPVKVFKLSSDVTLAPGSLGGMQTKGDEDAEEIVLDIVVEEGEVVTLQPSIEGATSQPPLLQAETEVRERHNCGKCTKVFKSKRSLQGHVREKHSGKPEKFFCPECEFPFTRRTNLRAHIRDHHPDVEFGPESPAKDFESGSEVSPAPGSLGGRQRKAPKIFDL